MSASIHDDDHDHAGYDDLFARPRDDFEPPGDCQAVAKSIAMAVLIAVGVLATGLVIVTAFEK